MFSRRYYYYKLFNLNFHVRINKKYIFIITTLNYLLIHYKIQFLVDPNDFFISSYNAILALILKALILSLLSNTLV